MSTLSQIGFSGIRAAQIALNTTGQNVANVNTPGYSRLVPELRTVVGQGGGVEVSGIRRVYSDFQNQQLWRATTELGYFSSRQQYLTALEGLVDSDGANISAGLDNFFAAVSEVSASPRSISLRQQVLDEARQLALRFNGLASNIDTQLQSLHGQRSAVVEEINGLIANIGELNARIIEMEATDRDSGTLRDYRDNLVKELSKHADVRTQEMADGSLSVSLANGQPLVVRSTSARLVVSGTATGEQALSLKFAEASFPLGQVKLGGTLGALHDSEYGALRPALADLRNMAEALAQTVNAVLVDGYDLNGNPGQPLFVYDGSSTSALLSVNPLSPEQLAFSSAPGEVDNNDVLLRLLDVRLQSVSIGGSTMPLNDAYASMLSWIASASRQNQADLDTATTVANQAQAQRDSVSAVSLDEEAINLMAYAEAYQANTKVVSTARELFDALLALF